MQTSLLLAASLALLLFRDTAQTAQSALPSARSGFASNMTVLRVYNGSWKMTSHPKGGSAEVNTLDNHCTEGVAFYSCEQIFNGKPAAFVIFVPAADAGHFFTQVVLVNGRATGRSDLTIAGDHWTYDGSGTDDAGKPVFYRTENFFKGLDFIHFEQFESRDQKNWAKKNEGDEVRLITAAPVPRE